MSFILASQSASRKNMLQQAGVPFTAEAADLDETAIKIEARKTGKSVEATALELATAKAAKISLKHTTALVLGADQMLDCENTWLSKAASLEEAKEQLKFLSGKTHRLVTSAVLLRGGKMVWSNTIIAHMHMRKLSDDFITSYTNALGGELLKSVGCYALEGQGSQLFTSIEGDFFGILGLPLLPLLQALREEGIMKE
jgi:septum formation protein